MVWVLPSGFCLKNHTGKFSILEMYWHYLRNVQTRMRPFLSKFVPGWKIVNNEESKLKIRKL